MMALRTGAAASRLSHVCALRIGGPGALELLDAAATSELGLRENQLLQTLLLDAQGRPLADVILGMEEDSWLLLAEGPASAAALIEHLDRVRRERAPRADVGIEDLSQRYALFGVDGPFAWELVSELLGPPVLGAPYLSFLQVEEVICLRAGKTGEYGYVLLVPREQADGFWGRLFDAGAAFELREADLAALDQCALENWHFFMRALQGCPEGATLTPLELQLQWRVSAEKDFEGAAALRERRTRLARRVTCLVGAGEVRPGDPVRLGERPVGTVIASGYSAVRRDWVSWASLDLAWAWPGIRAFHVASAAGPVPVETRSPPLLDNRSLFVEPHRHSFRQRAQISFPDLVGR